MMISTTDRSLFIVESRGANDGGSIDLISAASQKLVKFLGKRPPDIECNRVESTA